MMDSLLEKRLFRKIWDLPDLSIFYDEKISSHLEYKEEILAERQIKFNPCLELLRRKFRRKFFSFFKFHFLFFN